MMKINLLRLASAAFLLNVCAQGAFAESETSNPLGCQDTGYRFRLKTVEVLPRQHDPDQSMFFFYNYSNTPVTLHQMRRAESVQSLYINHTIPPHKWAVLAASEPKLRFICSVPHEESDYGNVVDCAQKIKICQNVNVRFGLNNKGNYWIVGQGSKNESLRRVVYYGIIP